jgi:hypothetical protein
MLDIHVHFFEAVFVEQDIEPIARGQLALGVLRGDPLLAPAQPRGGAATFELGDIGGHALSLMRFGG